MSLLINEAPLQVLPSLAVKVGLNEAIVLQQFHYWLQRSNNVRDGYKWIYNSYKGWNGQFPFWSNATLRRAISSLEKQGYLITGNFNKAGFDKTKWYRIDYTKFDSNDGNYPNKDMNEPFAQNEQTSCSKCANGVAQNEQTDCSKCANGVAQSEQTNTNRLHNRLHNRLPETNTHNSVRVDSQNKSSRDVNSEHQNQRNKEIEEMFTNQIWNKYPKDRCGDFKKALNGFKNALKQDQPKTIIEGVSNYIKCKRKANTAPRYWAILANLLNQRLYINDYSNHRRVGKAHIPYWQQPDYQPMQISDEELVMMEKKNKELMKKLGLGV